MAAGRDTRKLSGDQAVVGLVNVQPRGAEARWLLPFCLNLPTAKWPLGTTAPHLATPQRQGACRNFACPASFGNMGLYPVSHAVRPSRPEHGVAS